MARTPSPCGPRSTSKAVVQNSLSIPLSPLIRKASPSSKRRGGHSSSDVALPNRSATLHGMAESPGMRALVDALEEPALIVEGLTVSFANDSAKAILGSAIEGRDVRLAIRHPDALQHILSGRDGEVDVTGIGEVGRSWRIVVRDIGQGASFVRMIDRAAAVSTEKIRVDFVANASHELRTPLSTVMGYAETLADDSTLTPELRAKFTNTIRDEAARMLRIIEDLMSLSRIQADRFVEPPELVRVDEIVRTAIANASNQPPAAQCKIEAEIPEALPAVKGDQG